MGGPSAGDRMGRERAEVTPKAAAPSELNTAGLVRDGHLLIPALNLYWTFPVGSGGQQLTRRGGTWPRFSPVGPDHRGSFGADVGAGSAW